LVLAIRLLAVLAATGFLAGCGFMPFGALLSPTDCMTRVMYFESNRSSAEGMLAVGTVVMNRMADRKFPNSVCGVVGQPNQFAPGVLWLPMKEGRSLKLAHDMATKILRGYRYAPIGNSKYFHTAGYSFPYTNMRYTAVVGGNAFYYKA
jgi:spore germination cell wall hydrolase CwlJ-like protein